MNIISALFVLYLAIGCLSHTPAEWKTRLIYQVLTDRFAKSTDSTAGCSNLGNYCGGTYQGIIKHLDYIQKLGFNAIWISPIVSNTNGGYHGYWANDLYQLNTNFGNANDLKQLVTACHSRDIWVMVDVVANHVGPVGNNFATINPFNSATHYHDCSGCNSDCSISNFQNQPEVEHCRLSGLPDLDQSNAFVANTLYAWIANITKLYGFDGIRIDTVPEVSPAFWPAFNQKAGVYAIGEVFDGRIDYVANYTKVIDGVLSYPLYFTLKSVFQNRVSANSLQASLQQYAAAFKNLDYLGTFIDNHDNARFLNGQKDQTLYQNALAYVIMAQGIPILYYGSEQGFAGGNDPNNREPLWTSGFSTSGGLFQTIATLASYRVKAQLWNYPQVQRYSDDNFYAFTRGNTFVALTNGGASQSQIVRQITFHPYLDGTKLCNLMYPQDCITVSGGKFSVYLNSGEFKVLLPA